MAEPCLAPIFGGHNFFACFLLALLYTWALIVLTLGLAWLTEEGRCLMRQYLFRVTHCRQGNADRERVI